MAINSMRFCLSCSDNLKSPCGQVSIIHSFVLEPQTKVKKVVWGPRPRLERSETVHSLSVFGGGRVYLAWCWELEGASRSCKRSSASRQTRERLPIPCWDPTSSSSASPPYGTHSFLAGPKSVREKKEQCRQDRFWPQQGPALLTTGISGSVQCCGCCLPLVPRGRHTDPGCCLNTEHAGTF